MWFLRELGGIGQGGGTGKLNSNQGHHLPEPGESFPLRGRMWGSHSCRDRQRARGRWEALTPLDRPASEQAGPRSLLHLSCCLGVLKSDPFRSFSSSPGIFLPLGLLRGKGSTERPLNEWPLLGPGEYMSPEAMARAGEKSREDRETYGAGWVASANHASRWGWGAQATSHRQTGQRLRGGERRGSRLSPSCVLFCIPTACNDSISSFVLWRVAHLLRQNIGCERAGVQFPHSPQPLQVWLRDGAQHMFVGDMS